MQNWILGIRRALATRTTATVGRAPAVLRRIVTWGSIVVGILLLWGGAIEPRLVDEEWETVSVPELPSEWEHARLALIADLQIGMWLANTDTVQRIVARLVAARPDAVLIAGDFLYHPTEESGEPQEARAELERDDLAALRAQVADVVSLLAPLPRAGITTVATLGNHDYAMRWPASVPLPAVADELSAALTASGVTVLRNAALPLGKRDAHLHQAQRLHIAGLDAWFPRRTDVPGTLAQLPAGAPRVWLMHNPLAFRELPAGTASIAVAAHTHGGQFRLPFTESWSWMSIVKESPVAADGWIPAGFGAPGNRLYVNRGIGFSVVPIRINCRPELTWLVLERADGSRGLQLEGSVLATGR